MPNAKTQIELTWKEITFKLWGLLDDISTLDDVCKKNHSAFRRQAYDIAGKRDEYMYSPDGYKLIKSKSGRMSKRIFLTICCLCYKEMIIPDNVIINICNDCGRKFKETIRIKTNAKR